MINRMYSTLINGVEITLLTLLMEWTRRKKSPLAGHHFIFHLPSAVNVVEDPANPREGKEK
ncbi:hypothetical protein I7I50_06596 [Histoplasma capsulatum G186AR]|uniref:Uncharacterized protein n=1 Tax=Ajellomyces capsulatus TaxID=5037 RepID=A0A8H7YWJ2_AJECA|nr:hypothetical protein I7I52_10332 [Histoplasma capsulatum]QSS67496.1 hypothetical protein I7I50_06596 [Histoplasma capsulatum G186AR]